MFWRRKKVGGNGATNGNGAANPLNPEQDIALAQQALARGDLKHAAFHVGGALATDPDNQDWLTLLDQIIAQAGTKALDLAPLGKEVYYGTAAVRAYILAKQGDLSSAVQLLLSVIVGRPDIPYAHWLLRWRDQAGFAAALTPELAIGLAVPILNQFRQTDYVPEDAATPLANLETVLALATELHPDASQVWFFRSIALRKRGLLEEAARVAEEGDRRAPSYETAVAMAGVYRKMGNFDAAITAYRDAIHRQPNEAASVHVHNDIADILCGQGKVEEGVREYRAVLDYAPDDAWALPSYLYYMHDLYPDEGWDTKLSALAAPDNQRAQELQGRLTIVRRGYLDHLPEADEAIINLVRQLIAEPDKLAKGGKIEIGVSHLESPSARLAITMELAARFPPVMLELGVADIPTPDPRAPRKPVPYVLWSYDGMTPRPAVAAPNPAVASAITAIARTPFNVETWRGPARRLSQELGPQALGDLLAVMVHASAPPDARSAWDWIRQMQIASALTIAQLGDSSWEGSLRRDALLSLVYGPMDWAGVAGLVALASLAAHEPILAPSVEEIYLDLLSHQPSEGAWALRQPLVLLLNRLPNLSERGRAVARQELETLLVSE
jgi:tetratricopeptide (TPR) repeat protein